MTRRARWSLVLVPALVLSLGAFGADARSPRAHGSASPRATSVGVLGYIESGDGAAVLRRNLPALSSVGIDGVNLTSSGGGVSSVPADARALLVATHRAGKRAELLVGNFSGALGDFDPAVAHRLFASAAHRRAVIAALRADVRDGWDGIHLDLESLHGADMRGLTRFTTELRAALPAHKTLSMAVMASTSTAGYRAEAYDLPALARRLTRVVLMAYDQHGPTWTGPGPVGGLPWVRRSLHAMLLGVPRAKAVLGVAGYGYSWPTHGTGGQYSDASSRALAEGRAQWDATQAEWHATRSTGTVLWWSDARSLRVRRALAADLGIAGVAVWSLGLSDRITR